MKFTKEEYQEILAIYKAESEEHLSALNSALLALEKEPGRSELLEDIFREAHSLKGSARMIGFEAVEHISHTLEDIFSLVRKGDVKLEGVLFDLIFEALDAITEITAEWLTDPEKEVVDKSGIIDRMKAVQAGEIPPVKDVKPARNKKKAARKIISPPPGKEEAAAPPPIESHPEEVSPSSQVKVELDETIRVTTQKLDDLMGQIGEILVTKIKFDQRLLEVRRLERLFDDFYRDWMALVREEAKTVSDHRTAAPVADGLLTRETTQRLSSLYDDFSRMAGNFSEDSLRMTLLSSDLQESINRVRMLPLSSIFNLYPRLMRDIAREEGKDVELIIEGGHTQLDKKILEALKDPLNHILRNAVDHGIEGPQERVKAGKSPAGKIRLAAFQKASSVMIKIDDDGAGMEVDKIRNIAMQKGLLTEESLPEISDQQILSLIFRPGFSTKGIITDLSGRGVGLDVVMTNIEKLKGTISVSSSKGKGTTLVIKIPISLATVQSLLVKVAGQLFAIPLTAVEVITEIGHDDVMTVESKEAIMIDGSPVSLSRVQEIMNLGGSEPLVDDGRSWPVVVIGSTDEKLAVMVDELVGEQEIVVKNLGPQLVRVKNISGATILGDGRVVPILNVFDLIKVSQKSRGMWISGNKEPDDSRKKRFHILVADDSVTTRVLEKNILEGNGYEVTLAVDGQDAFEKATQNQFDLIVSDVEMPRKSGFELTKMIRQEKKCRDIPVILVTSLESEEDKMAGIEAGADAYITKGAFDQGNLLETIKQLI